MDNQNKYTPFKDEADFEKELIEFANHHKTVLAEHSRHISDYFEMSCYTMVVRFYELKGFKAEVDIKGDKFKFKCTPRGLLENFSFFRVKKDNLVFRIYHNASVQSKHDKEVFTTPDIVVANDQEPQIITDYYITKQRFSFIPNNNLITFCEAKHYNPYPELMINFIGTVSELKPSCFKNLKEKRNSLSFHIAPSLMMAGTFSKQGRKIKKSLERRYMMNVLGDLIIQPYQGIFSLAGIDYITTLGEKGLEKME